MLLDAKCAAQQFADTLEYFFLGGFEQHKDDDRWWRHDPQVFVGRAGFLSMCALQMCVLRARVVFVMIYGFQRRSSLGFHDMVYCSFLAARLCSNSSSSSRHTPATPGPVGVALQDYGPAYRNAIGLPGGVNGTLYDVVLAANVNAMELTKGLGGPVCVRERVGIGQPYISYKLISAPN